MVKLAREMDGVRCRRLRHGAPMTSLCGKFDVSPAVLPSICW